jgi:hypothetical protein
MVPEGAGQEWGSCEALWDSGDKNKPVLSISEKKKRPPCSTAIGSALCS